MSVRIKIDEQNNSRRIDVSYERCRYYISLVVYIHVYGVNGLWYRSVIDSAMIQ